MVIATAVFDRVWFQAPAREVIPLHAGAFINAMIAEGFGYEPEAAFSRAFKKYIGASPGSFRRKNEFPN